jgi:formylglycine-generating enzyme required for sulfatase activity
VFVGARDGERIHLAKQRRANPLGVHDLHGNVDEWCADAADGMGLVENDSYRDGAVEPLATAGERRVYRGGNWSSSDTDCRCAARFAAGPSYASATLGLRVALARR